MYKLFSVFRIFFGNLRRPCNYNAVRECFRREIGPVYVQCFEGAGSNFIGGLKSDQSFSKTLIFK